MGASKLDPAHVWMRKEPVADSKPPRSGPASPKAEGHDYLEEARLAWAAQRNPANAGMLLKQLEPTIDSAMTSYAPAERETLHTRARLIALQAADTYDPRKGTKLNSHVFTALQALNREKARRQNIIHVPENILLEQNRLRKSRQEFTSEIGREPTIDELADHTGMSVRRIEKVQTRDGAAMAGAQTLTEKGDLMFSRAEDPQRVWADYVYHDLDERDKKIFEWSTGYGGSERLRKIDIAKKLKITPAAVSHRIGRIVGRLEEGYSV